MTLPVHTERVLLAVMLKTLLNSKAVSLGDLSYYEVAALHGERA